MVLVHRYRTYDIREDDHFVSTRMATEARIAEIGAEIVPGTAFELEESALTDGWTPKNFEPLMYLAEQLEKRIQSTDEKNDSSQEKTSN